MLFSSSIFIFGFLPFALLFYFIIPNRMMKNIFLFIISLAFYAWGEPIFVLLMIVSILANYGFGLIVDKYHNSDKIKKLMIIIMLIFNIGILFVFKYIGFFIGNLNSLFDLNLAVPQLVLPIGISFFTFQAISYVIDVYRRNDIDGDVIRAQRNPINVGLYISLFPQLIAGPIVRYKTVAHQINHRKENVVDFSEGVRRFMVGFSKKVILSNNLALIADKAFSLNATEISVGFAWLGAVAYALQIFYDFSGYSDMAIGLGKMFGFHFLENFNYPYISKSVSEFWRRWHISLGSWFRDYIYFPLGGSRAGSLRVMFNLFVVWFCTGFWHGANWTYVVWGLYFFVFIALEKYFNFEKRASTNRVLTIFKYVYALLIVLIGWVFFRSSSLDYAFDYLQSMFGINSNGMIDNVLVLYIKENFYFLIAAIIFAMPIAKIFKNKIENWIENGKINSIGMYGFDVLYIMAYVIVFIYATSQVVQGTYNPFIYFNF